MHAENAYQERLSTRGKADNLDLYRSRDIVHRTTAMMQENTMTTITYSRETAYTRGGKASSGLLARIRTFLARSRAEQQLSQLDDRLLADIGLKRSEITRMVWGD